MNRRKTTPANGPQAADNTNRFNLLFPKRSVKCTHPPANDNSESHPCENLVTPSPDISILHFRKIFTIFSSQICFGEFMSYLPCTEKKECCTPRSVRPGIFYQRATSRTYAMARHHETANIRRFRGHSPRRAAAGTSEKRSGVSARGVFAHGSSHLCDLTLAAFEVRRMKFSPFAG